MICMRPGFVNVLSVWYNVLTHFCLEILNKASVEDNFESYQFVNSFKEELCIKF